MIKTLRQLSRLFYINLIIAKYGIDRVILPKTHRAHFLTYLNPWNWRSKNKQEEGKSIRLALEKLGPIFVKFGQMLSTRRDLIPTEIAKELSKLQDQVPPFSGDVAQSLVEKTYRCSIDEVFKEFGLTPLASASIAQVHAATLKNGKEVVVKILRPNIKKIIQHDIALLYAIAKLLPKFMSNAQSLHITALVSEFQQTLIDELDFMREGANASQLKRHFLYSDLLYIPEIHWKHTHENLLVMERITGIPILDISALRAANIDLKQLSERMIELFFTQVFRDSFFHADMHPGNIFVTNQSNGIQYIFVDFGIVGMLDPTDQHYIAENLMAFFDRDYRRVTLLHIECGWLSEETDIRHFESALRTACEPVFEKSLHEVSFAQILIRLFQTARHFNIEIQPQLLLLQKTLLNIEGLVRELCPDLDFWATSQPFLEKWIRKKQHPVELLKKIQQKLPHWIEDLIEPNKIKKHSTKAKYKHLPKKKPYFAIGSTFLLSSLILYISAENLIAPPPLAFWITLGSGVLSMLLSLKQWYGLNKCLP